MASKKTEEFSEGAKVRKQPDGTLVASTASKPRKDEIVGTIKDGVFVANTPKVKTDKSTKISKNTSPLVAKIIDLINSEVDRQVKERVSQVLKNI
jgi:hypothetical protein